MSMKRPGRPPLVPGKPASSTERNRRRFERLKFAESKHQLLIEMLIAYRQNLIRDLQFNEAKRISEIIRIGQIPTISS